MGLISRVSSRTYRFLDTNTIILKITMTIEEQKRIFETVRYQDDDEDDEDDDEDEEEMVDPLQVVRDSCNATAEGKALALELKKCTERVEADEETEETCTQELFDFMACRDKCVGKQFKSIVH